MSTTKITERNLDEKFLQNLYTTDNPPTASDIGAVAESELATAIKSLIDSGMISMSAVKSVQRGVVNIESASGSYHSATAKINAVDVSRSIILVSGYMTAGSTVLFSGEFVDSTTIKIHKIASHTFTAVAQYQIIEYA